MSNTFEIGDLIRIKDTDSVPEQDRGRITKVIDVRTRDGRVTWVRVPDERYAIMWIGADYVEHV